jgi:dipeptidase E
MGLILNAKDYKPPVERAEKKKELMEYFLSLGFQVEEVNLLEYVDNKNLLDKFTEFDVVWFNGGNTYCLRSAISGSNCEEILKQALESGVVYGGDSAGAILAGPTLKHFDSADDPSQAKKVIYDGLGLVDFVVLPHWGSGEFGEILKATKVELEREGYKTVALTDDKFLLIEV